MKIKTVWLMWSAFFPYLLFAQAGFSLLPGTTVSINSGTTLSIDSLMLIPSVDFTITGANSQIRNASLAHYSANNYIRRVYHYQNTLSLFSGTVIFYYTDAELNGLAKNALTLNIYDGVRWNAFTAGVSRDPAANSVTTTGLDKISLNELTLAALGKPLPVIFTLLHSDCMGQGVEISWTTALEDNVREFAVQKTTDGSHWQVIGTVPPSGNGVLGGHYSFIDKTPTGNDQYRIAEYDVNGKSSLSRVVRSSCFPQEAYAIYPNPASDLVLINLFSDKATRAEIRIFDAKGALVKMQLVDILKGSNQIPVNIKQLVSGTYQVATFWLNTTKANTIIKQ